MQQNSPSRTALRVAMRRATHQIVDAPPVFADPLALRLLPEEARQRIFTGITAAGHAVPQGYKLADPPVPLHNPEPPSPIQDVVNRTMRAFMAVRSRYAEDALAQAVANGCTQYVVLGAGLDTFAYRNPYPQLRVFEVDHPATQAWKLGLLAENGISIPSSTTHVAVDFEREDLSARLAASGFDMESAAVFAWLGVVPYLTLEAFRATLGFLGQRPTVSVVFDYGQPREALPLLERIAVDYLAARVAKSGEPFQLFFTPQEIAAELRAVGFNRIEDLGGAAITTRYFSGRSDGLRIQGEAAHLLHASR